MINWVILIYSNTTNRIEVTISNKSAEENTGLYLKFDFRLGPTHPLDQLPDGEYTYYVFPMDEEAFQSGTTLYSVSVDSFNGGSTPLDWDIVQGRTKERIKLRDLNPYTGLLRIGDVEVTSNTYDDKKEKRYYYEG